MAAPPLSPIKIMYDNFTFYTLFTHSFLPENIALYYLFEWRLFLSRRLRFISIFRQWLVLMREMPLHRQIVERLVTEAALSVSTTISVAVVTISISATRSQGGPMSIHVAAVLRE